MSRTSLLFVTLAAGLLASAPAAAQDKGDERMQALSDAELSRDLQDFLMNPAQAPCTRGIAVATEFARRAEDDTNRAALLPLARTFCAYSQRSWDEALKYYLELESYGLPLNLFLGLQVATYAEDHDEALRQLRIVMFEDDLPARGEFAVSTVRWSASTLTQADRGDDVAQIALDLARAGRLDALGDEPEQTFSYYALEPAITQAPDMVPDLLQRIHSPVEYTTLLALRKYEAIWPQVEARVGPHMQLVLNEHVAITEAALAADPANTQALSDAAHALYYAKRPEEAAALVSSWRSRPDAPEGLDEHLAWAINVAGYALHTLGRQDEADAAMAEIATADDGGEGWQVSFVINHASRLVGQGRYEEGLVALARAREVSDTGGSPYAKLLVARDHACALAALGRQEEAMLELPALREHLDASHAAGGTGLLCLGLRDEMVAAMTTAFADEQLAQRNKDLLQPEQFTLFSPTSSLPSVADVVQSDPQLRALLERHVRSIPVEFVPIG